MKSKLYVIGALLIAAGTVGGLFFGNGLLSCCRDMLLARIDDGIPPSVEQARYSTYCFMVLALGIGSATWGLPAGNTSSRLAHSLFGVTLLIAGALTASAIGTQWRAFQSIAASSTGVPGAEAMETLTVELWLRITIAVFAVCGTLCLVCSVASLLRQEVSSDDSSGNSLFVPRVSSAVLCGVTLLCAFAISRHVGRIESFFGQEAVSVKPSELAAELSGIYLKTIGVAVALAILGFKQILLPMMAHPAQSRATGTAELP